MERKEPRKRKILNPKRQIAFGYMKITASPPSINNPNTKQIYES